MVYLQRWHGWCQMKLLPSRRVLCTPYNHAPCHFMQNRIRHVHACLAVTCHLHLWQNDRDLLRATAVTRGSGTDTEIKVSTESRPRRRKKIPAAPAGIRTRPFNHESGALTTELSPLTRVSASDSKTITDLMSALTRVTGVTTARDLFSSVVVIQIPMA